MKIVLVKTTNGCVAVAGIGLGEARAQTRKQSTPDAQLGDVRLQDGHNL